MCAATKCEAWAQAAHGRVCAHPCGVLARLGMQVGGGGGVGWIKRHWSQPRETELPQADSRVRGHPRGGMVCQAPTSQLYHWYVMAVCHRGWWAVGRHVQHG
jgi:hypothetical protein